MNVSQNLVQFLISFGWSERKRDDRFIVMRPPNDLGLPDDYFFGIPSNQNAPGASQVFIHLLGIIGELYNVSKEDIGVIIEKAESVLRIRINDENTKDGKISLTRFDKVIEKLKDILLQAASFVIHGDIAEAAIRPEAQQYLNRCQFLQTEVGSFVAKIELPSETPLTESNMFEKSIPSGHVGQKVLDVLNMVSNDVFNTSVDITDSFLIDNSDKLNLRLLKSVEAFFDSPELKNVEFSVVSLNGIQRVETNDITPAKIERFNNFIEAVENQISETAEMTLKARVIGLNSKDPDGSKNKVTLATIYNDMQVTATANLASDQYHEAIKAHDAKKYITIEGRARRTKTKVKFLNVYDFKMD